MTTLFNHEAVTHITRETIEHSLRFFDRLNERLLEITKDVRPDQPLPRRFEEMNKVCETFQQEHRDYVTKMECVWRETFAHLNDPKNRPQVDRTGEVMLNLFDPNELLRLNRDVINTTVSFFSKTGENLFRAFDPRHPVTTPQEMVNLLNKTREEYEHRHHDLTRHIQNILFRAMDPQHTPEMPRDEKPRPTTRNENVRVELPDMIRHNREVIDHTVKFFLNMNDNLLKIAARTDKNDIVRHTTEILGQACEEYRKTHQEMAETFLHTTRETITRGQEAMVTPMNPIALLIDREELFKLNQETLANTVKFFLNLNDELVRTIREPGRPVSLVTLIEEYQRIHHILAGRLETLWTETLNRLNQVRDERPTETPMNRTTEPVPPTTPRKAQPRVHTAKRTTETVRATKQPRTTVRTATATATPRRPRTEDAVPTTRKPRTETKVTRIIRTTGRK